MSSRFVLGRENVPCVAEVVNRSLKADCTDFSKVCSTNFQVMFTLYRIVKRSATKSVLDRASVHTRNAAFEAVSAPEQ